MYTTKTFVEFTCPGAFFNETYSREVDTRDPSCLQIPDNAYAFQFYDIIGTTQVIWNLKSVDNERVTMKSERMNLSLRYYLNGKVMTYDEVAAEVPNNKILLSNMKCNGWRGVIKTRFGNFQPFTDGKDVVYTTS